jgi:UDP-N-acetylglucosamine 2-epimerase (non-hydrolysing)/GDP/UDP-N,N'-diacetylbacillosamine 2-epimerase (hydrolysing)
MKVAVVTSSRADWSTTGMVVKALMAAGEFDVSMLALAANGSALEALMAATREDGPPLPSPAIYHSLDLTSDDPMNLGIAMGHATHWASEALWRVKPRLLCLPGDRWEIVSAATAGAMAGIPIAHLGGGDRTFGSVDDKWRNVITQLASIHFATNYDAFSRLVHNRIGHESARWCYNVGSPSIDRIRKARLLDRSELIAELGVVVEQPFTVVNWQPETVADDPNVGLHEIFRALASTGTQRVVFVGQNPDRDSMHAQGEIEIECSAPGHNERTWKLVYSLPPKVYLSLLKHCFCLIGNSSSGIYEAPYLGTKVINVGNRQLGRLSSQFVIDCQDHLQIAEALRNHAVTGDQQQIYGDGHACEKIVDVLREFRREKGL